jgi:nitrite reductase (NADH) small subunit
MNSDTQPSLFPDDGSYVFAAKKCDIPKNKGLAVVIEDKIIAIFESDGRYYAIDDMCPHAGASLAEGYLENCVVACPWHAWRFDIRDGTWCDNRRLRVNAYPLRADGDSIFVSLTPFSAPTTARPSNG